MSDGVIHTGFIHDFSKFKEVCETDRHATETLGFALAGSDRPLIVTSGTALVTPGRIGTEEGVLALDSTAMPRAASEEAAALVAATAGRPERNATAEPPLCPLHIRALRRRNSASQQLI